MEDTKALTTWVKDELESIEIDVLEFPTMEKVVESGNPFIFMFVEDAKRELDFEKAIDKVADKYGIGLAKVEGLASKYGINVLPTIVYFEDGIPSIYDAEGEDMERYGVILNSVIFSLLHLNFKFIINCLEIFS